MSNGGYLGVIFCGGIVKGERLVKKCRGSHAGLHAELKTSGKTTVIVNKVKS